MQEPDNCMKATNKIHVFLEKRFKIDLSRFDKELLGNYFEYFDDSGLKMNPEKNSIPSEKMESDIIKELYKKTPLKKRPIQPSSLSLEEKKIPPKPRACTVPEKRLSKRKMLKPTKKLIDSYVESTAVSEPAQNEMCDDPVIKTSAEAKASSPVELNNTSVNMAMAIPELKKKTSVGTEVLSRIPRSSKALGKRNFTKQEWEDFNLAIELQKEEFNLRERHPKRNTSNLRRRLKRERSPVLTEDMSAVPESMDSNFISSSKMPNDVCEKQGKQEVKRIPKQTSGNLAKDEKDVSTCLFSGSHSQNMYILSPELANIVGHEKMSSGAIVDAMHYVFLERNLFEPGKKYVICDDELSEKLFAGERRLRFDDVKNYLHKHLTLTD